jgi:hypothetical protein
MDEILTGARALLYVLIVIFALAAIVAVFGYLRKKLSKTYTSPVFFDFLEDRGQVILAFFLVASAVVLLWIERYKFDHVSLESGESYPVRVNRITGNTQVLYRGVWRPSSDLPKLPPLIQDLTAQDLQKLNGQAKLAEWSMLDLSLYNGSDFTLKEITVEVVVTESTGKEVLRRQYRIEQEHPPKRAKAYFEDLEFYLGPGQNWGWKVVAARGIRR